MNQLAVDVDRLAGASLNEHKVVPIREVAVPLFVNPRRATVATAGGVPVNRRVAPRHMRLGIALAARGAGRAQPKRNGTRKTAT